MGLLQFSIIKGTSDKVLKGATNIFGLTNKQTKVFCFLLNKSLTNTAFCVIIIKLRGVAQLVAREVWEHRTVGELCRVVSRTFLFTLHRHGDFVSRRSCSKTRLTT